MLRLLLLFTVTLMWDANPEPDIAGYNIYRAESDSYWAGGMWAEGMWGDHFLHSDFYRRNDELIAETTYTDNGLSPLVVYRYVATAVNESDLESGYSNEVQWVYTLLGDANLDGVVTISDAVAISRHLVGAATLEGLALLAADANGDGNVSISDVTRIMQHLVGDNPLEGTVGYDPSASD